VAVATAKVEAVLEKLESDTCFYAEHALKIVTKSGELIPLAEPRPGQMKVERAMQAQEEAGKPIRVIVLKARQTGVSTWVQAKIIQRITRRQYRRARVVAHDEETASHLFSIGSTMYSHLPAELKPPLQYGQRGRMMTFGERARYSQNMGPGYHSSLRVDTASDVTGGAGLTILDLHLSEVALWQDIDKKLTALLPAVPDIPDSMIVFESTARGFNEFREIWVQAENGESDFVTVFIGWQEEPSYSRAFASPEESERFAASVGHGDYGEAEPDLLADGCSLEQLHWRRQTIANVFRGDVERFKQEFPSNAVEAFLATGSRVFEPRHVQRIITSASAHKAVDGVLDSTNDKRFMGKAGALVIPGEPTFKRGRGPWKLWRDPVEHDKKRKDDEPPGRYVVAVDVSSGGEADDLAWHAIQVLDHRTREQVARYRSRVDLDVLARQCFLAAKYFNLAWLAVEITGGWGLPVARIVRRDFRYPFAYQRKKVDRMNYDRAEDRLGWDTNRVTKPLLIEHGVRLVRDGLDGIRDPETAKEMLTFVRDEKGRTGPERGSHDDLLLAWLIGQYVAQELPPRRDRGGSSTGGGSYWQPSNPVTGY
jgi:hypothetical protein